jgi:hypothetical protein
MKKNVSGGVIAIVILVAAVIIGFFGFRFVSGGPNGDITQSRIQYYQDKSAKSAAGSGSQAPRNAPISGGSQYPSAPGAH